MFFNRVPMIPPIKFFRSRFCLSLGFALSAALGLPAVSSRGFAQELPEMPAPPPLVAPTVKLPVLPPVAPKITGAGAILMDAVSGQVLYESNADTTRPMASTTKIMTALLLVEHLPENTIITASKNAATTRESSVHLKLGEKLTAHDLLRAILLRSANDGCVAAAEQIAGSTAKFAEMMNQRARELGATHTHFMNPHGLHHKDHYTTPRDLALIARYAMQQPRIAEVVCLQKCAITRTSGSKDLLLYNHSHFLGHYAGADGVKTGWTVPAGKCYVGSATHNGWRLLSVTLKSKDYVADTKSLMDYGFGRFHPVTVFEASTPLATCTVENGMTNEVIAVAKNRVQEIERNDETPSVERKITLIPLVAPVSAGVTVGKIELVSAGKILSSTPLIARNSVEKAPPTLLARTVSSSGKGERLILLSIIFGGILVSLIYRKNYGKRIKQRNGSRIDPTAESAGNRRNRIAASLRNPHR